MGDYSRTAINTSLNTGTMIGVCCNVMTSRLLAKHIPSFTWDVTKGEKYDLEKASRDISNWMRMKNRDFDQVNKNVLRHIFESNDNEQIKP